MELYIYIYISRSFLSITFSKSWKKKKKDGLNEHRVWLDYFLKNAE